MVRAGLVLFVISVAIGGISWGIAGVVLGAGWIDARSTSSIITAACPFGTPDLGQDIDGDGLNNGDELALGTELCRPDTDADGFNDLPATVHQLVYAVTSQDSCPLVPNPVQTNSDGGIALQPDRSFDDITRANSDALGDACDSDDDNDGLSDADEASGAACGGVVTDSTLADTDGDRVIDRAECLTVGMNPLIAERPHASCNVPGDADGDGVLDSREFCFYGTSTSNINTDGDNCSDRREIMSINADFTVNALDLGQVAQAFGPYEVGAPAYKYNFDVTKDGTINALDLSQVAQAFGACP